MNEKMKAKSFCVIYDGCQLALSIFMLLLVTTWIAAHLYLGTMTFVGFCAASLFWGIMFYLARISWKDFKKTKETVFNDEED